LNLWPEVEVKFLEVGVDALPGSCEDHLHRHISIHLHLLFLAGYRLFSLVVGKVKGRLTGVEELAVTSWF
jgi:hypothetical protein